MPDDGRHRSNTAYVILIIDDCPLRRAAYLALFELYGSSTAVLNHRDGEIPVGSPTLKEGALTLVVFGGLLISSADGRAKLEAVLQTARAAWLPWLRTIPQIVSLVRSTWSWAALYRHPRNRQ